MTHTDDLRERITNMVHAVKYGNFGMEWTRWNSENQADRILAAVHASIAARAMSDEVVEAVANAVSRTCVEDIAQRYHDASGTPPRVDDLRNDEEDRIASEATRALLLALGITESEVEV